MAREGQSIEETLGEVWFGYRRLRTAIEAALLTLETTPEERLDEAIAASTQILRGALNDGAES